MNRRFGVGFLACLVLSSCGDSDKAKRDALPTLSPSPGSPTVSPTSVAPEPSTTLPEPALPAGSGAIPSDDAPSPSSTPPTGTNPEPSGEGGSAARPDASNAAGTPASGSGGGGGSATTPSGGSGGVTTPTEPSPELGPAVVYVGGFDYGSDTYPLRIYDLDVEEGTLTAREGPADAGPNPSYLAVAPSGGVLYAANERDDDLGGLTALAIADDGSLTRLNHQRGSDGGFTHVAIDPSGELAFGASYNGGSVSVFPIEADGSLGPELEHFDFGMDAQSHCVGFDASGQFAFVPNKGNDEVAVLRLNADGPPSVAGSAASPTGAGPRHIAVHPTGTFAAVVNELSSSVTSYDIADTGQLTANDTVSALPAGEGGGNTGAHIEFSPSGEFAYVSNRGHDSIAIFSVDVGARSLTLLGTEPTRGDTPRDFDVDPRGRLLIAANQDSGSLAVFRIEQDGLLSPLGEVVAGLPSPSVVQIVYLQR